MGTRSLTIFTEDINNPKSEIVVLYRQFDGYPDGHGKDLKKILQDMIITNGISMTEKRKTANGMGCLAAQVIAKLKGNQVGNFYLIPAGTRDVWEEYIYYIYPIDTEREGFIEKEQIIGLKVCTGKHTIYEGKLNDFDPSMKEEDNNG